MSRSGPDDDSHGGGWGGGEGGTTIWGGGDVDSDSVNAFLTTALTRVMRTTVSIPTVTSASVLQLLNSEFCLTNRCGHTMRGPILDTYSDRGF